MLSTLPSLATLADADLIATVKRLAGRERDATAALVAALAELDARRLYLGEGVGSIFVYCTRVLRLSEHAAYHRIEAARAARRFPAILERLADGSLTLTNATLLAPHLTPENHVAVLDAARHKRKREVERQVAALAPRPDVAVSIRKQPAARSTSPASSSVVAAGTASATTSATMAASDLLMSLPDSPPARTRSAGSERLEPRNAVVAQHHGDAGGADTSATPVSPPLRHRAVVEPLAPARYRVQMTVGGDTIEKLRRAQDLMRHIVPDGDPAAILDRALTLLLRELERRTLGAVVRPRPSRAARTRSRYVPAAVRRAVWARDDGRCTFVGAEGQCGETGFLQLHHLEPYALGGATTVEGMALRCRAHNTYEAEREFGVPVSMDDDACVASSHRSGVEASSRGDGDGIASSSANSGTDSEAKPGEPYARTLRGQPSLLRERRLAYAACARTGTWRARLGPDRERENKLVSTSDRAMRTAGHGIRHEGPGHRARQRHSPVPCHCPAPLAEALGLGKSEPIEWEIEDRHTLRLRRPAPPRRPAGRRPRGR